MSHLSRRYTDHFYREVARKSLFGSRTAKLVKVSYRKNTGIEIANAIFPCEHEERGFLPKKSKKRNHTHVRYKRRNKARIKARKAA